MLLQFEHSFYRCVRPSINDLRDHSVVDLVSTRHGEDDTPNGHLLWARYAALTR